MHLLARHHLPGVLQQHRQYQDGLIGNPDPDSVATQLSRAQIELERIKAEEADWAWDAHRTRLLVRKSSISCQRPTFANPAEPRLSRSGCPYRRTCLVPAMPG